MDYQLLQEKIKNYFKLNNQPFPDTWFWYIDDNKLYYIESKSKRRRYGKLKNCKYCNREFLVRNDWYDNTVVCSKFCSYHLQENKVEVVCAWCNKEVIKQQGKLKNSKSGLYFCNRDCKEKAQSIGGLVEIQPDHYKDGSFNYTERAFKHYGAKCCDCGIDYFPILQVHHVDGNRENGDLSNLEVVCQPHHTLRHMNYNTEKKIWYPDNSSLTPRDKLSEINDEYMQKLFLSLKNKFPSL